MCGSIGTSHSARACPASTQSTPAAWAIPCARPWTPNAPTLSFTPRWPPARTPTGVNVEGTTRWLEEGQAAGVCLQILLSTLSAAPDALSDYGRAKYALEQRFIEANQVVFRLAIVVGDGGMFARLRDSARRFPVVPLLDGGRQIVYVLGIGFLCNVLRDAVLEDGDGLRGRAWNLQQPTAYTLREVITAINRAYGYRRILLPGASRDRSWRCSWPPRSCHFQNCRSAAPTCRGLIQGAAREMPSDFARFGYAEESLSALVGAVGAATISVGAKHLTS